MVPLPGERWTLPDNATRYLAGDQDVEISASWAGVQAAEALLRHLNESAVVAEAWVKQLRDEQEGLLEECFAAERAHVGALHQLQDASSELRIVEAERQIFEQLEVRA